MHIFSLLRIIAVLALLTLLSACASTPAIDGETLSERQVNRQLVQQQQAALATISGFHLQGSVAFFDDAAGNRDAARFNWQRQGEQLNFRLFHQLGGTLARIEQYPVMDGQQQYWVSRFINRAGESYESDDLNFLLYQHTGMMIPFSLLNQAITGAQPSVPVRAQRWYENGTIALYSAELAAHANAPSTQTQRWQLQFGDYRLLTVANQSMWLPYRIEASQGNMRVNIRVSRWQPVVEKE